MLYLAFICRLRRSRRFGGKEALKDLKSVKRAIAAVKGGTGWVLPEPGGLRVTFGALSIFLFGEN